MKKAVFMLFLFSSFFSLSIHAQEMTGLLDPVHQRLWRPDGGRVIEFESSIAGISQDSSNTIYILKSDGHFQEIKGDTVTILESAGTHPAKILQYQIGKRGEIAILRADGTIEINFKALAEEGENGHNKALNLQMAFSSEDGLWVFKENGTLYKWSKDENQWKFIVQDEGIRSIVAIQDSLYALREVAGPKKPVQICQLENTSSHWIRLNFENIVSSENPAIDIRTLGFDGTHLLILIEKRTRLYSYDFLYVPIKALRATRAISAKAVEMTSLDLSRTPPSRPDLQLMTPKGMMCQPIQRIIENPSPLDTALEHMEAKVLEGVSPSSLPPSEMVDKAVREILGDLSSSYQYEMLLERLKRSGKSSAILEETMAQMKARQEPVNTQTLEALRVCLEIPQLRRLVLERMADVFLEAQKQGKRFLK